MGPGDDSERVTLDPGRERRGVVHLPPFLFRPDRSCSLGFPGILPLECAIHLAVATTLDVNPFSC